MDMQFSRYHTVTDISVLLENNFILYAFFFIQKGKTSHSLPLNNYKSKQFGKHNT